MDSDVAASEASPTQVVQVGDVMFAISSGPGAQVAGLRRCNILDCNICRNPLFCGIIEPAGVSSLMEAVRTIAVASLHRRRAVVIGESGAYRNSGGVSLLSGASAGVAVHTRVEAAGIKSPS